MKDQRRAPPLSIGTSGKANGREIRSRLLQCPISNRNPKKRECDYQCSSYGEETSDLCGSARKLNAAPEMTRHLQRSMPLHTTAAREEQQRAALCSSIRRVSRFCGLLWAPRLSRIALGRRMRLGEVPAQQPFQRLLADHVCRVVGAYDSCGDSLALSRACSLSNRPSATIYRGGSNNKCREFC
jgi:hypothetical protein